MLDDAYSWIGGGLLLVFIYIIVSNTLWLLFGSRLIQCLPGVNIKGFRGTIKIAAMIVLSLTGILYWTFKYILFFALRKNPRSGLKEEVGKMIQRGSRVVNKRIQS